MRTVVFPTVGGKPLEETISILEGRKERRKEGREGREGESEGDGSKEGKRNSIDQWLSIRGNFNPWRLLAMEAFLVITGKGRELGVGQRC